MAECSNQLRTDGKPSPRMCAVCGLGPCIREPQCTQFRVLRWRHADGTFRTADSRLWGTYTRGMDEWTAYESRRAAHVAAANINSAITGRSTFDDIDPFVWVIPDMWPDDADDHAKHLKLAAQIVTPATRPSNQK